MTSCFKKEEESYLPCLHRECEKAVRSLISLKSDSVFLLRKVQVQAGCGSSSFIIHLMKYFKILHYSASNRATSVTLISNCFVNKCKVEGKGKPVHRVLVQPHSIQGYFCILYSNCYLVRTSDTFDEWVKYKLLK